MAEASAPAQGYVHAPPMPSLGDASEPCPKASTSAAAPPSVVDASGVSAGPSALALRLTHLEHALLPPGKHDDTGTKARRVPVLRAYGTNEARETVCVHLHGAYPYCYIPYTHRLEAEFAAAYISQLDRQLNAALAASFRRPPPEGPRERDRYLHVITLVKAVPFYGYHVGWSYFLKITFYDPSLHSRIHTILLSGRVMNTRFQPYEIHIRYQLQWLLDFNVYGCDWLRLARCSPTQPRQSHCPIEVDAHVADILNRRNLKQRNLHHQLHELPDQSEQRLVPSLTALWQQESARRVAAGLPPTIPGPAATGETRRYSSGESPKWQASERLWAILKDRIGEDCELLRSRIDPIPAFARVLPKASHAIPTAFESVCPDPTYTISSNPFSPAARAQNETRFHLSQAASSPLPRVRRSTQFLSSPLEADPSSSPIKGPPHCSKSERAEQQSSEDEDDIPAGDLPPRQTQQDLDFFQSQQFAQTLRALETRHADPPLLDVQDEEEEPDDGEVDGDVVRDRDERAHREGQLSGQNSPRRNHDMTAGGVTPQKRVFDALFTPHRSSPLWQAEADDEDDSPPASPPFKRLRLDDGNTRPSHSLSYISRPAPTRRPPGSQPVTWQFSLPAPTREEVMDSLSEFGLTRQLDQPAFYANPDDLPSRPREYAGRKFTFQAPTLPYLSDFVHAVRKDDDDPDASIFLDQPRGTDHVEAWTWSLTPPPPSQVWAWVERREEAARAVRREALLEHLPASGDGSIQFSFRAPRLEAASETTVDMSQLAIEVFARSRGGIPDPVRDAVQMVAYAFVGAHRVTGVLVLRREGVVLEGKVGGLAQVQEVEGEAALLAALVALVRMCDPDILVGYELRHSWSYIVDRARDAYGMDIVPELGRLRPSERRGPAPPASGPAGETLRVSGRHVLNLWRLMRGEAALTSYTYESVVYHILHRRVPVFAPFTLAGWWDGPRMEWISRVLRYTLGRAETVLELVERSELVSRTSEFARVYGIEFFSVLSRGSQFKVESVMGRIAKGENYLLPSPSVEQVASQNAAECIPLILEPLSGFFSSPLVVLDFQSLYPSMMIAYNICYSTCLGRVEDFKGTPKLGFTQFPLSQGLLCSLGSKDLYVSPNGLIFVKPWVREGLLGRMLAELLATRIMVRSSASDGSDAFKRKQNARQLSLKLLANVTYGYTSATFSGRMPCVEVADAIVQYGRETLERAIRTITSRPEWGAQIVYGDTDSIFVYLPGRTREDAFRIGQEMATVVTSDNPAPVTLKFEKVYDPSVLVAKKRYAGRKFESPASTGGLEVKGLEVVRRDGHHLLQRVQRTCLELLFSTRDLSQVKAYLCQQLTLLQTGDINPLDLVISKEVRMGSYSARGPPPPGAAVAARLATLDHRKEAMYAERVPYIISQGEPGAKLVDLALPPEAFVQPDEVQVNTMYYIERTLLPPLARIFNLLGVDVHQWFATMPRPKPRRPAVHGARKLTLDGHYRVRVCSVCGLPSDKSGSSLPLINSCSTDLCCPRFMS